MASNKRRSERIDFREKVQVYTLPHLSFPRLLKTDHPPILLKGRNISKDGICLEACDLFAPDHVYRLDFEFFKGGVIHTFAKVIWSGKDSCGMRFLSPEEVTGSEGDPKAGPGPKLSNYNDPLSS
jgi:hypothetical protein